jgi:putative transposase
LPTFHIYSASPKYIIDKLLAHQINLLVIGQNQGWKQNLNIGDRNNQSFVNIPHSRFIEQLTYKAILVGIKVITTNESYTSKCSFLDLEPIGKQEKYGSSVCVKYLSKINYTYLTTSCLLPLASCLSSLGN